MMLSAAIPIHLFHGGVTLPEAVGADDYGSLLHPAFMSEIFNF